MNASIRTRSDVLAQLTELEPVAFSLAEASGTLPGLSDTPECALWRDLTAAASMGAHAACVFVDGRPAKQVTQMTVEGGGNVLGVICARNLHRAEIDDAGRLVLIYADGVEERYRWVEEAEAWLFESGGAPLGPRVPTPSAN